LYFAKKRANRFHQVFVLGVAFDRGFGCYVVVGDRGGYFSFKANKKPALAIEGIVVANIDRERETWLLLT
jgi:hypothetical protein